MRIDLRFFLLACLPLAACDAPPPSAAPPPVVKVGTPTIADTDIVREFVGSVAATSEVEIRSKVTGIVAAQEFREGQTVAEGQVLFRLSAESPRAGSDYARSQLRNAQAALDKAVEAAGAPHGRAAPVRPSAVPVPRHRGRHAFALTVPRRAFRSTCGCG